MKSGLLVCAACIAAVTLVGCGGAASRKARHVAKGQEFLAADNYEKARIEFRNALQIVPNDSGVRYENGVVDEKLGNPREAAQFYQGAIDSDADNVPARAALGRLYLFSGAPEKALDTINPGLTTHPADPSLLTVRAAVRVQLKDLAAALEDAREAVQIAPTNEDAVAVLAGVYKSEDQPDEARALLEATIKRVPGTVDLRLALAQISSSKGEEAKVEAILSELIRLQPGNRSNRLRLAQHYTRLNRLDDAERVLRDAIGSFPDARDLKIDLVDFLAEHRGRDEAAKELNAMIAAAPKDYDLRLAQARFYEQNGESDQAPPIYLEIIAATDPQPPALIARNRLAALKVQANDVAGAEKLLSEVLARNPRDNDALIIRGNLALAHKDPKSAIIDLRAVLRDQPNAVGVMRALARAHLANGETALAEETMRRAMDANPADAAARLDLAQLLAQIGKPEQAKPIIDQLVKDQPNNVVALDNQFRIAVSTGDMPGAKTAADAIVALEPNAGTGYYYQGVAAEAAKHADEAIRLYLLSLEKRPAASEPLQALAVLLIKQNRMPEALKRLDEVSKAFPKLPLAADIKGDVLLGTQHPTEAQAAYRTAIEREPKWWMPYRGLARADAFQHDNAGAASTLQAGIAQATEPEPLQIDLARVYEEMGREEDAIRLYETALHSDPRADIAANNLAMILVTFRKDKASLDRAKELVERFSTSNNLAFLDTYGWVLYKHGEAAAAVGVLQNVLTRAPESPVFLYHLGMAQASAGQDSAARESLARSLKSGTNFQGISEAKSTLDKLAMTPVSTAPRS